MTRRRRRRWPAAWPPLSAGCGEAKYLAQQSVGLYPTAGAADDYVYSRHLVDPKKPKVLAFTVEWGRSRASTPFHPPYPEMRSVMREMTAGLIEFCRKARNNVSDPTRKMNLTQATMLVAGNMIGTGVFLLPVNLASVGGISVFGWLIATAGAAALGMVFAKLGELEPKEGGPYAYARDFLGPYVGFQTNYVYWFGNWIGNIAIAIAAVGYLAELVPGISMPPASVFATAGVIWLFTFANIQGPRVVGLLEAWTMSLALIPILAIAFLGWFWFQPEIFQRELECERRVERARDHAGGIDRALGLHGHRERLGVGRRDREPEAQHPARDDDRARARRRGVHAELDGHHGDHPERGIAAVARAVR